MLTVQLSSAGAPVGLRFAAPLLVGQPAAGSTPAPAATTTPAAPTTPAAAPSTSRPATTTALFRAHRRRLCRSDGAPRLDDGRPDVDPGTFHLGALGALGSGDDGSGHVGTGSGDVGPGAQHHAGGHHVGARPRPTKPAATPTGTATSAPDLRRPGDDAAPPPAGRCDADPLGRQRTVVVRAGHGSRPRRQHQRPGRR